MFGSSYEQAPELTHVALLSGTTGVLEGSIGAVSLVGQISYSAAASS